MYLCLALELDSKYLIATLTTKSKRGKRWGGGELKFIEEMAVKFGFNLKTT